MIIDQDNPEGPGTPATPLPLVLVIDDDGLMRMLAREALEAGGFRVEEACSAAEGLAAFPAMRPAVILLDVVMPGMDGFSCCAAIRAHAEGARVPILMITGLDDAASINRAYEAGATDFVAKPIAWPVLAHRVRYMHRAGQAIEALVRSEQRLAEAQRMAQLGYWEWNVATGLVYRSDEVLRMFGVARERLAPEPRAFLPLVHPDDRATVEDALREPPAPGATVRAEYRVLRPDGEVRYVVNQARGDFDSEGRLLRVRGTAQDVTERREAEARMRELTWYDPLTGLANRSLFAEQAEHALALAGRLGGAVAVLVLDVDRFRRINETLGHAIGDDLLREIASRFAAVLRDADVVGRSTGGEAPGIARFAGDAFTVLLSGLAQPEDVAKVARRLQACLVAPVRLGGHDVVVSASIGIAVHPADGREAPELLRNAESAMRFAKTQGQACYQFFSPAMNASAFRKLALESSLRKAVERGELALFYQPKVDARNGALRGYEALLRWRHPDLGLVAPADFIPLAEETGLIVPIGEWVAREACRQIAEWRCAGRGGIRVAVNMASANLAQESFVGMIDAALREFGIARGCLEIEITESVMLRDLDASAAVLAALKVLGVRVSVDDFGTGHSSLAYLKRLPIDTLKIDRSFVRDVDSDREDAAIVNAIIVMARSLGLEVVAEGVETVAQAAFLRDRGCDLLQGYLYGHALPARECRLPLAEPVLAA